jgi:hypothetical protein
VPLLFHEAEMATNGGIPPSSAIVSDRGRGWVQSANTHRELTNLETRVVLLSVHAKRKRLIDAHEIDR